MQAITKSILFFMVASLWAGISFAENMGVANVSIGFGGNVEKPEVVRVLIAQQMRSLVPAAKDSGATAINLQSVGYTLTPDAKGYKADGNLLIDVEPPEKTNDLAALLTKKGYGVTINYFQRCIPQDSR